MHTSRRFTCTTIAFAALITLSACGSDKTEVVAGGDPASGATCLAPAADGKPKVMLPKAPATELDIKDDKVGTGETIAEHATVKVNYVGCGQISGKQFDSSWDRGQATEFNIDQVFPGWTKGLLGMKVGGRRTLTIPGALAYGANPPGADIAPDETLVFVVDLVSITPPAPTTTTIPPDPEIVKAINARGKPKVVVPDAPATDLKVIDDVVGTGPAIAPSNTVTVQYVGVGQISKQQFDASWDRGEPATFNVDQVIVGWKQGLIGMKVGGRRTLIIPGALAYGPNPPSAEIKADETLVFVVDLVSIN